MKRILRITLTLGLMLHVCMGAWAQEVKTTTILALGDSITQGGGSKFESYTLPLWQMLNKGGYSVSFLGPKSTKLNDLEIHNCGFSGRTVEYIEEQIEQLYGKYPADVVLLHAGHNHFIEEKPVGGMIAAHRSIIEKIIKLNPDVKILVAQTITSGKLPKYSYIPELNKQIKKMVKEFDSKKIILVNQAKGWDWQKHTIQDRVHPNKEGSTLMAKRWMKSLRRILPRK